MHALRIVNDDIAVRALLQDLTAADTLDHEGLG